MSRAKVKTKRKTVNPALFSYRRGTTVFHKTPALVKLVLLLLISLFTFGGGESTASDKESWIRAGITAVVMASAFILGRISVTRLKKIMFVPVMGLMMTIFRVVSFSPNFHFVWSEAPEGLLYTVRFLFTTALALAVFETTSPFQMQKALEVVQKVIFYPFPFLRKYNPAGIIGISIGFIPKVFASWEKLNLASLARCPRKGKNKISLVRYVKNFTVKISGMLSLLLHHAETTRKATLNRTPE